MNTGEVEVKERAFSPELDAIKSEALAGETAAGVQGEAVGGEPLPVVDPAQEWRDASQLLRDLLTKPEYEAEGWTRERFDNLGDALAKGAERWGWSVGGIFGHPAVAIGVAAWPIGGAMVRAERKIAEREAAAARQAQIDHAHGLPVKAGNLTPA